MHKENENAIQLATDFTEPELKRLEEIEESIRVRHIDFIVGLSESFEEIDRLKLYRVRGYASIEEYVHEIFKKSRDWYYKIHSAAKVIKNVDTCLQDAGLSSQVSLPHCEGHARHLASVPEEHQAEVWLLVVTHCQELEKPITVKIVESIVKKWKKDRSLEVIEASFKVIDESLDEDAVDDTEESAPFPLPQKRGEYTKERKERESEEFREVSFRFFQLVEKEVASNFRNVSKAVLIEQIGAVLYSLKNS